MRITPFRGPYEFLSNMHACKVELEGIVYPSSEHAYQAYKFADNQMRLEVSQLDNPVKAKHYKYQMRDTKRQIIYTPNFDMIKVDVMTKVVQAKFFQNKHLMKLLIDTQDHELVEEGWWHDNFWGNCTGGRTPCKPECKEEGFNQLGTILMSVRSLLQQDIHTEEFHETA